MLGDEHFTNVILNLNLLLYLIWVLFTTQYRDLTFGDGGTNNKYRIQSLRWGNR